MTTHKNAPEPKIFAIRLDDDNGPLKTKWIQSIPRYSNPNGGCKVTRNLANARRLNWRMAEVYMHLVRNICCHERVFIVEVGAA